MDNIALIDNKHIVLSITDSKISDLLNSLGLASVLIGAGAKVGVILSPGVERFLSTLNHKQITDKELSTNTDPAIGPDIFQELPRSRIDLLVISPCKESAMSELLTRYSHPPSNKLRFPVLIVPATGILDSGAFGNKASDLAKYGIYVIGADYGSDTSSQTIGKGAMMQSILFGYIRMILGKNGKLAGKKVVVTAGGTLEPIDPVRVITNRSSGKQGYAIAQAAIDEGAKVTLVSTPTQLAPPIGASTVIVTRAKDMLNAVMNSSNDADVLIMAAAVADFQVKNIAINKIKKQDGLPRIELEATPDILAEISELRVRKKRPTVVVGFAAESQNLLENAARKLDSKKADIIIANDITSRDSGFGVNNNRVTLLYSDGRKEALPLMSKIEVAEVICDRLARFL